MFHGKKCRRRRISETREECWYVNIDSFRYSNTHYSYGDIRQITEGKHWRNLRPLGTNHVVYACVCTAYHITPFISFGKILRESWSDEDASYLLRCVCSYSTNSIPRISSLLSRRPVDLLQRINQIFLSQLDKIDIT